VKLEKSTEIWVEDEIIRVKTNDKAVARSMKKAGFSFAERKDGWLFAIPMSELEKTNSYQV
jgi:hypothetical protein